MSAIEVEQITKTYKIGTQETHALRGVTASFNEGEFTALVGPSGSGKSTLLQIIGCLDQPTSGALRIKGQDVSRLNADQRADLRMAAALHERVDVLRVGRPAGFEQRGAARGIGLVPDGDIALGDGGGVVGGGVHGDDSFR